MYWQKLDRGHTERFDVFYNFTGKTLISAAPLVGQLGMKLGVSAQMQLVDDRVLPRDGSAPGYAFPIEVRVDQRRIWA